FLWSNGATTEDIGDLPAGDYTLTVTDANGCATEQTFTVGREDVTITVTAVISNITCIATGGVIDLTVSGGTEEYTYLWSNGEKTEDIDDLAAGNYTVRVTDANGCETEHTFTVEKEDQAITGEE